MEGSSYEMKKLNIHLVEILWHSWATSKHDPKLKLTHNSTLSLAGVDLSQNSNKFVEVLRIYVATLAEV